MTKAVSVQTIQNQDEIRNDLQVTLLKAKTVAEAYSIMFVESASVDDRIYAVRSMPDMQCNLYSVLEDLIHEAGKLADTL